MVEVFRSSDSAIVGLLHGVLESEGIHTLYRNQTLSSTEAMIPAFYPALCVMNPEDEDQAKELIEKALGQDSDGSGTQKQEWKCDSCGEKNPGAFELCWSCQVPLEKSS